MNEKRKSIPLEIEDAFSGTCAKVDVLLEDTEQFITSKKVKSFDETLTTILENTAKIESFTSDALAALKQCSDDSNNLRDKFQKIVQTMNKTLTKMQTVEREKTLQKFSKQSIAELKQEVSYFCLLSVDLHGFLCSSSIWNERLRVVIKCVSKFSCNIFLWSNT